MSARAPRGVYFLPSWEIELLAAYDWPGAVACHSAWRWPAFAAVRDGSRMALDWLKQCNPLLTVLFIYVPFGRYSCRTPVADLWRWSSLLPCAGRPLVLLLWRQQGQL